MLPQPFYDPAKSYLDNFEHGPFGLFADAVIPSNSINPTKQFLGYPVFSQFGIPAGPLLNGKFVKAALDWGFDIPVYKTVRTHRHSCHPWPNVLAVKVSGDLAPDQSLIASHEYAEPLSITNSFGVPSFDPDFWQPDMADAAAYAKPGQVVVGSYQGTLPQDGRVGSYIQDFVLGAKLIKETGVKIVEVNLSCPNEGTSNLLCFDIQRSKSVVEAIKNEIGNMPLIVKMAYYKDNERLAKFLQAIGATVDGISAINTISAEIRDEAGNQALPGEGRLWSGVCGSAVKWAGLMMTAKLSQLREELHQDFQIIGVGGVGSTLDFDEYRLAGADAVMSATGAMWNPTLAREIKEHAHEL
jgi:dihydroorotate dehydrogenase (NAD+) catalytic subunit